MSDDENGARPLAAVSGRAVAGDANNDQRSAQVRHVRPLLLEWLAAREPARCTRCAGRSDPPQRWSLDTPRPATFAELVELGAVDTDALAVPVVGGAR
jgi:hypothetical protein